MIEAKAISPVITPCVSGRAGLSGTSVGQGMICRISGTRRTSERMFVSYCQCYLQGDDFLTPYDDADTVVRICEGNSLAAGGPEHLTLFAGTHTGWIRLTTAQCTEGPPPPGPEWETVWT
ncbi:hypothetical protein [Streptomyces kanasensis]|uniref:hypothetical protein n=1 Tax=Streptomyces kanasensis TaxID=936756 RepID=UPI00382BC691